DVRHAGGGEIRRISRALRGDLHRGEAPPSRGGTPKAAGRAAPSPAGDRGRQAPARRRGGGAFPRLSPGSGGDPPRGAGPRGIREGEGSAGSPPARRSSLEPAAGGTRPEREAQDRARDQRGRDL